MKLRPFQARIRDKILSGKSFILQAPTGAGKTRAALEPFFTGWANNDDTFPRKCFYVVPRRVLASQFYRDFKEEAQACYPGMCVTIQTGEQSEDTKFEGHLIFCTIDQFLSSYLTMPYSLPRRLANINAGALVGSYIIMDEFHLHDPQTTLPTALYALKHLRQVAPVLLMTATFSEPMLKQLADWLQSEYECLSRDEAHAIDTVNPDGTTRSPRQRSWIASEAALNAQAVLHYHQYRSIALCNTVDRTQTLFDDLDHEIKVKKLNIKIFLIHSRFLKNDRAATEKQVIELFGKDADREQDSYILVATQAIEVGVDISSQVLHTESAPASSLIQRAGRCARYASEQGRVFIYPVEEKLPYTHHQADEVDAAYKWIQAHSQQVYDFGVEQQFVNDVASPHDRNVIEGLSATRINHEDNVTRVLKGDRERASQTLIRDADSRKLIIHADPDQLIVDPEQSPYDIVGFNISPTTLYKPFKKWQEDAQELGMNIGELVWVLHEETTKEKDGYHTEYGWVPVRHEAQFLGANIIAVSCLLATYDQRKGLLLKQGGEWQSYYEVEQQGAQTFDYGKGYKLESYEEHIRLVLEAMNDKSLMELARPMQALERAAKWQDGGLIKAARLAALLHDVGKLSVGWQTWVETYQREIGSPIPNGFVGAHTDSERGNVIHQDAAKKTDRLRPTHAAESVIAAQYLVHDALQGEEALMRAVFTAIARHHTAFVENCAKFGLIADAANQIRSTFKYVDTVLAKSINPRELTPSNPSDASLQDHLANPGRTYEWLAYTLLARALRGADSEGTRRGGLH